MSNMAQKTLPGTVQSPPSSTLPAQPWLTKTPAELLRPVRVDQSQGVLQAKALKWSIQSEREQR